MDDNAGIRRALEILLPTHFAEVKTIPSPATLVSSLEQFRPDVVLLDMNFNTSINTVHIARRRHDFQFFPIHLLHCHSFGKSKVFLFKNKKNAFLCKSFER